MTAGTSFTTGSRQGKQVRSSGAHHSARSAGSKALIGPPARAERRRSG